MRSYGAIPFFRGSTRNCARHRGWNEKQSSVHRATSHTALAFVPADGGSLPAQDKGMGIRSVFTDLPQREHAAHDVTHGETQALAVRRPARMENLPF